MRTGLCQYRTGIVVLTLLLIGIWVNAQQTASRQRICINEGWRFMKYDSAPDPLIFDVRPRVTDRNENAVADTNSNIQTQSLSSAGALKNWILPIANDFIKDPLHHYQRPAGDPGSDFPFVQNSFKDDAWETVNLPHDWAIKGPFYDGGRPQVGGGMGRLPSPGVAWYRRKLDIPVSDKGRSVFLDIDGAMSYAMVWINGHLAGGWPYGYNSFRVDLTPFINPGADNQLAIRLDNPPNSSRWYPGGGIYRNVWLVKVNPVHIAQWGTSIQSDNVSSSRADVHLVVDIENKSNTDQTIEVATDIYALNDKRERTGNKITSFLRSIAKVPAGQKVKVENTTFITRPLLWGPPPLQSPHLYLSVTRLYLAGKLIDEYETRFGIRTIVFDPIKGVLVNGLRVRIQGVNQHADLGALGAAFNIRAAERQLEMLRDMGCNAIRTAHSPPAPELLDLADRMGFLVLDEIFDCWQRGKTPLDFHLIFDDWHEADIRSFVRRDRNHPSVIAWSFGNEVGEQYTAEKGATLAKNLHDIVQEEDSTRPSTASMNYAKPDMPFPSATDIISLNYQGEGIRDAPAYAKLRGVKTTPLYSAFQEHFPGELIWSSETASALSTRGTFLFPVFDGISAPVSDSTGGDPKNRFVSAFDLYTAPFGASPDKVFTSQDKHPFVAGEFVWSGWDYLGEPTPYYSARSSYSGIIDLAGFRKDRFYLYQSRWKPDYPMAHIIPHWTWPGREGQITPVHVYSSGDEAELFLNGRTLGMKKKGAFEYRFRWDSVKYMPGELKVVTYKNGKIWATDVVRTAGNPVKLQLTADRSVIKANGNDLSFITVKVLDSKGTVVPEANNKIGFEISGPGEIVATDNGNPADLVSFSSKERNAFSGMALVIVRAKKGMIGSIRITAKANGVEKSEVVVEAR